MKPYLVPFAALALLVGACSSTQSAQSAQHPNPQPARLAGTLQTAWGDLPTYQTEGSAVPFMFQWTALATPAEMRSTDVVVVDVLVNRDGSISDTKVYSSSGFEAVDRYTVRRFAGARALLEIAATDPAPYVIRKSIHMSSFDPDGTRTSYAFHQDTTPRQMGTGQPSGR